jgi:hypothetical protein
MKFMRFMSNDIFAVCLTTAYLLLYITLLQFEYTQEYAIYMLLFSPVIVVWLVYAVLKYGTYDGPELGDDEFGYQDKSKDDLGIL